MVEERVKNPNTTKKNYQTQWKTAKTKKHLESHHPEIKLLLTSCIKVDYASQVLIFSMVTWAQPGIDDRIS